MGCCFDINLSHNEDKAFSALFDHVVGRIVMGVLGCFSYWPFPRSAHARSKGRLGLITVSH